VHFCVQGFEETYILCSHDPNTLFLIPTELTFAGSVPVVDQFDDAEKDIAQVLKVAPNSPQAHYLRALIAFRKNDLPGARERLVEVLKLAPDHIAGLLLAGTVEFLQGTHALAQSHLGKALARVPGNLHVRKLLISSFAAGGQLQRAIETLQPALRQAPEDPAVLMIAGGVYMRAGEYARAKQYFEQAARLDPKHAGARTGLGLSRIAAGEKDRGYGDLAAAGELDTSGYRADMLLVISQLQRKNFDQAAKAAAILEKKQPDNPLTHNLKAVISIGKNDIPAARKSLERALELQPSYVPAANNLARLDLQDGNPKAARARLQSILDKDNANVEALLALARLAPSIAATQKEEFDWLERARMASPSSLQPQLMLARLHVRTGNPKKGLEFALVAQANNPENPDVLDVLGQVQMAAGDKQQALSTYGKLVKLQPKSPEALLRFATAQAENGEAAAAAATLTKALSLKADFIDAHEALARLEIRAKRYADALQIAHRIQRQEKKSPRGFVIEGDVLLAQKQFEQAILAYKTAAGLGGTGVLAIKLHEALRLAGKPEAAAESLARRLKDFPEDHTTRMYAAELALAAQQHKTAMEHYEWILQRQPDNVVALNNLATAYHQVKDLRALQFAERAYALKPESAAVTDTLGWILVEQGKITRGLELLQKAAFAAPHAQEIRYHLAVAWAKSGDKVKARQELLRLLSTGTSFPQEAAARKLQIELNN